MVSGPSEVQIPRPDPLSHFASCRDGPDGLDDAVANDVVDVVQVDGGAAVAGHDLDDLAWR